MSFLAPLYLLGGIAVSLPILLHLIRRTPRSRQPFSSLMFLSPTPPRITRRSRIEHWLLLALRAAIIALLALAFSRPYLRATASLLMDSRPGRRVAILLDTSASMRRGDLWRQAMARAEETLDDLGSNDVAALFRFDQDLRTLVDFPEPTVTRQAHLALLRQELKQQSPSWHSTKLGRALANVADALAAGHRDREGNAGQDNPGQIVLISDVQQGADLSALQGYDWPRMVPLRMETVRLAGSDNAAVRLLTKSVEAEPRARVSNAASSQKEEFKIGWLSASGELRGETNVYVPAGQSRVAKLADRPTGVDRLRLTGDSQDFDNDFFVSPLVQRQLTVTYFGDDSAEDPRGLRYFLARVWPETSSRRVTIKDVRSNEVWQVLPGQRTDLIVVASVIIGPQQEALQKYLHSGGTALFVVPDVTTSKSLQAFLPGIQVSSKPNSTSPTQDGEFKSTGTKEQATFALLTEIDFTHPVFSSFADPRFGDFTKIRFWKHQPLRLDPAVNPRMIARFDDGSPAFWEQSLGSGHAFIFTSSWRPTDSQLALSSKFVPLLSSLLMQASGWDGNASGNLEVGDSIPITAPANEAVTVIDPNGLEVQLAAGKERRWTTDQPGNYRVKSSQSSQTYAVNLTLAESDTAPMPIDRLEQLGVRIGSVPDASDQAERERQMRDIELESRQKLWQWLLVIVLALLGIETAVAARASYLQERAVANA